jgi:phosphoribosylformylglycinamidine synthase
MGAELGATVELDRVPLKYEGLSPTEIWISEAQERMVLAVPSACVNRLLELCAREGVEASDIGTFAGDGELRLLHHGELVGELSMQFLHEGLPRQTRTARWLAPPATPLSLPTQVAVEGAAALLALLASPGIASRRFIIRQYDHEVQGASVLKPLVGVAGEGPADAVVIRPLPELDRGLAVACGCNPHYGRCDPYRMAAWAIDEAVRNLVASGADPTRIALLDNFSWGNTRDPEQLGMLVAAARACRDVAIAFGTPFISGKDSLNNEFLHEGRRHVIPPTLLISALGIVESLQHVVSTDLKHAGHCLIVLGETDEELGGSAYVRWCAGRGGVVPVVALERAPRLFAALASVIRSGWVRACHDLSEGGLAVALAEMTIGGRLGVEVELAELPVASPEVSRLARLYGESATRWVLEVAPADVERVLAACSGLPVAVIGRVASEPRMVVLDSGASVIDVPVAALTAAFAALDGALS